MKTIRIGIDARDVYTTNLRGVGKTLLELLKTLLSLDENFEFTLYCEPSAKVGQFSQFPNVKEVALNERGYRFNLWEQVRLPYSLFRDPHHLFHCTNPIASFYLPTPDVVTIHDLIPLKTEIGWSSNEEKNFQKVIARNIRRTKKIITVSNHTKKDLIEQFNVAEDRIKVIYWGLDGRYTNVDKKKVVEFKKNSGIHYPYFLSFGGGSPHKNLQRLIGAFSIFKKTDSNHFKLILTGTSDRQRHQFQSVLKELGIDKDVIFFSFLPEEHIPYLLAGSRALVYVSLYEGFGVPILEAMASKTPIVTSNVTSLPEIAGEAAYYVNPYSQEEIAEGLKVMSLDDHLCFDLVKRGDKRIGDFCWTETAKQYINLYREILS